MPGIADLLYLGQPDPARLIAQALSGQQPQPPGQQPPQGAAPPAGPPTPADGAAPNPAPGAPPPPGSAPQPQALQSSPDMQASYQTLANPPNLMSLYLQLDQRQRASDQINRGFALIAANHAGNPAMMRNIMDSVGGSSGDPGSTINNLMSLYQGQQQMSAQQDMLKNADAWDAKLNLPPGTSRDMILAGRGNELIKSMEPTEQQRNIQAQHDAFIKGGGTEEDWSNNILPMIITGGIPGMTGDMKSMNIARVKWQQDPANAGKPVPGYLTDPTKWGIYSKDLIDAKGQFNGMSQALTTFMDQLGEVSTDKNLDSFTGSALNAAKAHTEALNSGSDAALLTGKISDLAGTAKSLASRQGPKGVGQNLATIGANSDNFGNLGTQNYRDNIIAPRMRSSLQALANAYGAAGQVNSMPGYLKPYLDQMYAPGGDLDVGGAPKAVTPNKDLKQPQDDPVVMDHFKKDLERAGPRRALDNLKAQGYDTSSLE